MPESNPELTPERGGENDQDFNRRLSRIVRDAELSEADISMPNKIDVLCTLEYAYTAPH